jgi:hypothetical protein
VTAQVLGKTRFGQKRLFPTKPTARLAYFGHCPFLGKNVKCLKIINENKILQFGQKALPSTWQVLPKGQIAQSSKPGGMKR